MDDLASLWATCSFMCRVCGTTEVGRRIPLRRVLSRQGFWERHYYDGNYRTLLTTRLASVGNLEACFLAGLRPIFMEAHRSLMPPIELLEHSTKAVHKVGMYVFTLVLYRSNTSNSNDDITQCLLRELEGADKARAAALLWKNQTFLQFHRDMC